MAKKILIVAGQFNEVITGHLLNGAKSTFDEAGIGSDQIQTEWVAGCYEMPVVAAKAARSGRYKAVVCLGCVIRGETPHFDYVAGQCASGLMSVSVETEVPVIFGVLTTENVEQAMNRAGLKHGNKGRDAAMTAISTLKVLSKIEESSD